jgi:O-antigen ligase
MPGLIWSTLAVGLILLGRWTPERLFDGGFAGPFWALKIAALLVLLLIPLASWLSGTPDRRTPMLWLFAALMGYVMASYTWNPSPTPYANAKLADLGYNAALVAVAAVGLTRPALRRWFLPAFLAALAAMAVIGLAALPSAMAAEGRLSVLGGGPNIFGRNMGLLLLICLYAGINYPKVRILCFVLAGVALAGLIASGSRGAIAATVVGVIMLMVLDRSCWRALTRRPLLVVGMVIAAGVPLLLSDISALGEIGQERVVRQTLQGGYLSYRDILFQLAWDYWLRAPLLGNGLGSFSLVLHMNYSHNVLTELLSETGLIGFAAFMLLVIGSSFLQMRSGSPERGLVVALLVLLFLAAQVSGDLVDTRLLFLFTIYPAAAYAGRRRRGAGARGIVFSPAARKGD